MAVGAIILIVDFDSREPAHCDEALTRVFGLLGKRWSGMVLGVLLERPARFAEIARAIPTITEGMLSARLSELQEAGLIEREVVAGPPIASVYRLTQKGAALRPALLALGEWASKYMPAADRSVAPR
jgi:DNA-binding HxlR family transcriptional regulator